MILFVLMWICFIAITIMAVKTKFEKEWMILPFVVFTAFVVVFTPMAIVENTISSTSCIAEYDAAKETIEQSRTDESTGIERAALTQKIIEINSTLAKYKALSDNPWVGIFYSDKIAELEYLK